MAAMDGIKKCISIWESNSTEIFTEGSNSIVRVANVLLDKSSLVVSLLIQQSLEKMDKVRSHALQVLFSVLHSSLPIPHKNVLLNFFPTSLTTTNFSSSEGVDASSNFRILTPCLDLDTYRYHVLLGYVVSVGGMGKNVSDISTKSLVEYLQGASSKSKELFLDAFLAIFRTHAKNDRIIVPALKTLTVLCELLWGAGSVTYGNLEQLEKIIKLLGVEVQASKEVPKLQTFIEFAGNIHFLGIGATTNRSLLSLLLRLLAHRCVLSQITQINDSRRYPLVRKSAASQLFKFQLLKDDAKSSEAQSIRYLFLFSQI